MTDVKAVREGRSTEVFGELVTETFPKAIVGNFVDAAARDLAESIAPLPSLNCTSSNMVTQKAKRYASKKTKIGHYYWQHSELEIRMVSAADQYLTYGFLPFVCEPDWDAKCPRITPVNPLGCYPEVDRFGRTVSFAEAITKPTSQWASEFPDHATALLRPSNNFGQLGSSEKTLEVIRFSDADQMVLYVPKRGNLVLSQVENLLGRCPVQVAIRPGLDDNQHRGQYDETIWVQLARAKMALYAFNAVEKTVNAPMVLPDDVQEFAFGSDGVIRTANPQGVHRVGLEMSPAAFQESQVLDAEMRTGSRYSRPTGNMGGSNITGRGIQELSSGFDTQIKTAQTVLGHALSMITAIAFEMDEKFWPHESKTIRGTAQGAQFEETYKPSVDINGDYTAEVTYGFAAGMDPSRALVFLLQLRSDKVITRDFLARQLPFNVDVTQLTEEVDIEELRDALKQGIFGLAASLPTLAPAGMDPSDPIRKIAAIIQAVSKGKPIEQAASEAFPPPPPPEPQPDEAEPGAPGAPGAGPPGNPLQPGVAPGQAEMGPGGQPTVQTLMAGMRNGRPNLSAGVSRKLPG